MRWNWSDDSEVAGQRFEYGFDDIGNRKAATINSHAGTYTANSLNQYTQRIVPGYATELGTAATNATVTINNQSVSRHGEYFSKELSVANNSSTVFTQLVTAGVRKNHWGQLSTLDKLTSGEGQSHSTHGLD